MLLNLTKAYFIHVKDMKIETVFACLTVWMFLHANRGGNCANLITYVVVLKNLAAYLVKQESRDIAQMTTR